MHDVRQPKKGDLEENLDKDYYNSLILKAQDLERVLTDSREWKDQGYDDKDIKLLEQTGMTTIDLQLREKYYLVGLRLGSNGEAVWELQKMLNTLGDSIPEDGIFNQITINRLREFQTSNGLFPSGEVTENTLKALLK